MRARAEGADPGAAADLRTRVKICGLTRPVDARAAARLGADAVGVIFHPPSPRAVTLEQAGSVARSVLPFVTVVGVFVNPRPDEVARAADAVPLDRVQFHGDESPELCARSPRPWIKAIRMRPDVDLRTEAARYAGASALLLDTWKAELWGGTGRTFDWSLVPDDLGVPVILAGGLSPENVAAAVAALRPYGVDGNGGVEAGPGIKDAARIAAFVREVKRGEAGQPES